LPYEFKLGNQNFFKKGKKAKPICRNITVTKKDRA
jgi:hypothetical protein